MSRIGKYPVVVPSDVTVAIENDIVKAKGKLGELSVKFDTTHVAVKLEDGKVVVSPLSQSKTARSLWGTTRAEINTIVKGVHEGFKKNLELVGVGYKARVAGHELVLSLGFSHDVNFNIPQGITITCASPTQLTIPVLINNWLARLRRIFANTESRNLIKEKALNLKANISVVKKVRRNKDK